MGAYIALNLVYIYRHQLYLSKAKAASSIETNAPSYHQQYHQRLFS